MSENWWEGDAVAGPQPKPAGNWWDSDPVAGASPPKPSGGLAAAAKQAIGAGIKGAGQVAADFLPGVSSANPVSAYGQSVIDANPTAINSLGDIVDSPWTATKEAVGNAAGSMGSMLGARALGMGITASAPFTGPAAPVVAGAGQLIANVGPFVAASLPSYGGIRESQIKADPVNEADGKSKAIALLGASTVGAIEGAFGPQAWALAAMKKGGIEAIAKQFADAKSISGAIGKGVAKGAAVEGAEELVQNPIEQVAGYQDPTTRQAIGETLFGGAMGAIGGGVLGGGMAGVAYRQPDAAPTPPPAADPVADPIGTLSNPQAGPIAKAAATGMQSGAVQQKADEQAAVTLQTQSENEEATNGKTNPSDARAQGAPLAQNFGPGEAPIQAASSPLATGLAGYANPPEVTTAPQGPAEASPLEQQQAIAAPESTVTPSAPIVDTTQAAPTGVPQQPIIGGISNGNQTEIPQPAAAGRPAQPATAADAGVTPEVRAFRERRAQAFYEAGNALIAEGRKEEGLRIMADGDAILRGWQSMPDDDAGRDRETRARRYDTIADELEQSGTPDGQVRAAANRAKAAKMRGGAAGGSFSLPAAQSKDAGATLPNASKGWQAFPAESGTLGIPRADMPQIKSEHRGAMVGFMNARGVQHQQEDVAADSLLPTQAEFSPAKVKKAAGFTGNNRSILVSSDGHVLDGHHQWLAALAKGEPVKVIRLDAPISKLIELAREFPSSTTSKGTAPTDKQSLSVAREPAGASSQKSRQSPIQKRDDLIGAIMRVTGGNGIAANMALTIAGDTAPKLTRLRGLFTNRGTSDLGEVAMLLREEEGFDVRDGERLSELIRDASFGNVAVSMERHGRDMDADKERRHRDRIRAQAKKYGVKVVGVKFSVVEGRVLFIEQRRQRKAVELLLDRDKARFDAAVAQSEGLVSDDEIQAILNDVAERGITGRDAWQEALVLQRQLAEEARFKQEQGYIENAEDRATDEEPDWFKDFDDEADSKLGNEGTTAASDDFGLEQQTISDIDRQEADRVAAEKAKQADAAQEAADRAASEKQSLADKIKARAEDPDNFQFGEDSKAAAKPMGGLFDQPAWPTKTEKPAQEYAEGDKVRFTPHDVGELRPVVEGILIQKASTTGGNFRLRIRTETPNEHGGGNVTPQVYSQNGTIEKIGDGLNAPRDRLNMTPDQAAQHRVDMLAADFTSTIYEESKTDDFDPEEVPAGAMGWAKDAGVDERAFLNSVISAVEKETFRRKAGVLAALRAGMQAQSANPEPVADPKMSVSANTIFTESAADAARALLKRKLGQLNSGIDPEIMQAGITLAGYHIEKGARTFAAYAKAMIGDLGDAVLPYLKSWYMGVKFDPRAAGFEGMDSSAAVEAASVEKWQTQEQENVDDERSSPNLERDSQDANDENGVGSTSVRDGSGIDSRDGKPGVRGAETDSGAGSSNGLPGREAAVPGTDSDRTIYTGKPELSPGSAGNSVDERSGTDSLGGPAIEPPATAVIEAAATGRLDLAAKVAAQAAAPTSPQASIKDALPMLQDGQQEDVAKAEKRFSEPDGYGMLFTNGTGTGKTFTGLGVVKRFVNAGKSNILIVAPNDKIIEDWQKSGKLLGLDVGRIADTNDAGRGVVITTYANMGQNNALAGREWDLVVHDEAHYLAQDKDGTNTNSLNALRAITLHPDGANDRTKMLYGDILQAANSAAEDAKSARMSDDARNWPQAEAHEKKAAKLFAEFADRGSEVKEYVESKQGSARPRALFLSFTPFAYEPTIDWANGYLFDYNEGRKSDREEVRGYNEGSNRSQFFMQNFGYRMRYGKLTKPDAKVDSALMQRQFNSYLKKKGSLSGRMLDVAADYDRRFVLVDSAIGSRIDEALQWFEVERKKISNNPSDDPRRSALYDVSEIIAEKFDYLSRRYLLEAIKAREVVPHIREHLAMGRKVVVFHDYKKGGGFNPFDMHERTSGEEWSTSGDTGLINEVIAEFRSTFADLIASPLFKASSPITYFQQQFPDVLLFNGDVPAKKRRENVAKFQDDDSGPQVLLAQSAAAKEGISLHDTTGKHQRVMFNLGQPTQPTTAMQQEGRIYRIGQVTDAIFRYLNTGTNWEKWAFATTIATRASAAENLGSGELARALKSAFISGFEESGDYRAGMEGEGKGGKDRDKASNDAITEYDRARAFYFGTQKKNSRTKAQEGPDYFATPEPVGLKMVEWADIRPGDDVLEPSAGHGAIARWMPDSAKRTAVEPSMSLRPRLAMVFDGDIIGSDFESLNVVNKYDAIVMNPPFGSGGRMAVDHLSKAATHLRDGGRIVALLPRGPAADKNLEKWYEGEGEMRAIKPLVEHPTLGPIYVGDTISTPSDFNAVVERAISDSTIVAKEPSMRSATTHFVNSIVKIDPTGPRTKTINTAKWLYLIADVDLPTVTFERAGTAVRSHIIVLEKQTDKAKLSTVPQQISMDYTDAANIGDLFARMENAFVRPRENARKEDATAKPSAEAKRPAGKAQPAGAEATVEKALPGGKLLTDAPVVTYTTKSGKKLEGVIAKGLSKDDAKAIDPFTWAKDGGFFIRVKHVVRPKDEAAGLDSVRYNLATDTQSTPADRAVYGMVADGKSAAEVLSFISKASRRPFNRVLASHLARIGVAPNITLDSQGGWQFGNTSRAQRYAAAYNPKTDTVALFTPRDAERHALHEMVHAATLKAIAAGGKASVQMRALYLYVKRNGSLAGQYGMTSIDEFVAEAFSNPKFQQALKAIPAPAGSGLKSAWQWFVRAVARILGLRTAAQETALDRAMTVGAQLMRENAALTAESGGVRYSAASSKDGKEASEYESRLFGGSYSNNRLRGVPKDAPIRKMIANARQRYNELRKSAGLPEVSDWTKAPDVRIPHGDSPRYSADTLPDTITIDGVERPTTNSNEQSENGVLFYDKNENAIVWSDGNYRISVNRPGQATSSVLWHKETVKGREFWAKRGQLSTFESEKFGKKWLRVQEVAIEDPHRGGGFGLRMYQSLLDHSAPGIAGILSHSASITNKKQVPAIHRRLGAHMSEDGDFYVIDKPSENSDIRYNIADDSGQWQSTEPGLLDDVIYKLQHKQIDTRRTVQAITKAIGDIADKYNPELKESLYHGRAANETRKFLDFELRPLTRRMIALGVDTPTLETFLWARHAEERNSHIAKINPRMPDGGSGLTNAQAKQILSGQDVTINGETIKGVNQDQLTDLAELASMADAMLKKSRALLVSSGLETQAEIDAWEKTYQNYVPLHREEFENDRMTGRGLGMSVKGPSWKRAIGSDKPVGNILAAIVSQREMYITRAEKRRVGNALYGLATTAPNEEFWKAVDPAANANRDADALWEQIKQRMTKLASMPNGDPDLEAIIDGMKAQHKAMMKKAIPGMKKVVDSLVSLGLPAEMAERVLAEPKELAINPRTGMVVERVNPMLRHMDNVVSTRINGRDVFVVFNARNKRASRMAIAMKNLDADQLGFLLGNMGKATRYFAAINTQFNPIFGVTNFVRDIQTAMLNLSSTPLADHKKEVATRSISAMRGIYSDLRAHRAGNLPSSKWAAMFERFKQAGGATGYRDMFETLSDRSKDLQDELKKMSMSKGRRLFTLGQSNPVFAWLSDYNEMMENAVRVAAFSVGIEQGLSDDKAASLAKELTVNFNKKGQVAAQAGAMYAFFNAAVQGSARIAQTLFVNRDGKVSLSSAGKKIVSGGIMLGVVQAILGALSGWDDDEPPQFVRERSLIIPLGDHYFSVPMPLGFNVLPNIGRITAEFAMSGFKDPAKRIGHLLNVLADTLNPIGNAGVSLQTIAPTVIDPLAALAENKDWTGKPIKRMSFNEEAAGYKNSKDTATVWSKWIAEGLNYLSGGTEHKAGLMSPTPDQIDYLIGQATGGVGREIGKASQVATSTLTGESLPLYKVPLVGKFIGSTTGQAAESSKFYANLSDMKAHKAEIDGRREAGQSVGEYLQENPDARVVPLAVRIERGVQELRRTKRELVKRDAPKEQIEAIDTRITAMMKALNDRVVTLQRRVA